MAATKTTSLALFLILINLVLFPFMSTYHRGSPSPSPSPKCMEMATTMQNTSPSSSPSPSLYPSPSPKHMAKAMPTTVEKFPRDALKLGVCVHVWSPSLGITIGDPPAKPCCAILFGLFDLEAAICLCTAIKANICGVNMNFPIAFTFLLNVCDIKIPPGYIC
ncbi:lipid transfer protein EARLI 1-like [Euphorbia lathyris]|uniref:lipid transfer protein EARLI 1-like n=1 Tax=Euphorbia lathyris TaxID=212925 RepID=UPI003313296B